MSNKLVHLGPDQFERFVDQSGDVVYQTDAAGRITYVSSASEKLLGHSPGALLGTHYLFLVRPSARNEAFRLYGEQVRRKTATSYHEFPAVTANGRAVHLAQHVQLLRDDDAVVGFHAVAHDITDRRQAESDRSNRDARLQALRVLADRDGIDDQSLTDALAKAASLLGMETAIVVRKEKNALVVVAATPETDGCHPGTRLDSRHFICGIGYDKAFSADSGPHEDRDTPFESPCEAVISVPMIWEGHSEGCLTFTDPTPRSVSAADEDFAAVLATWLGALLSESTRREHARNDHRRWERVLESVEEAVFECSEQGVVSRANAAALRMLRRDETTLVGSDIRLAIPGLLLHIDTGKTVQIDAVLPDGSTRPFEVRTTRIGGRLITVARDEAERTRGMRSRKTQEAVLRSFFEAAPVLMGVIELDNGRLSHRTASPASIAFFDLMHRNQLASEHRASDELPGAPRWLEACTRSLGRHEPVSFETGFRERRLLVTVNRIEGPEDGPHRFTYMVDDITERALEADHIARRRAEFEAIFEAMPEAVVFADADRRIVAVNPAFSSMFRHSAEAINGLNTERLFVDRDEAVKRLQDHPKLDGTPSEFWFERADGTCFLGETIGAHVRDAGGRSVGFLEIIRDVTREKESEEHIRFQAGILSQVRDSVVVLDHEMRVTYWNQAAEALTGYSKKEATGRSVLRVARFRWMSPGQEEESIRQLLNEGTWTGRLQLKTRDNEPRVIEAVVGLLRDALGDASGVVVGARDITATVDLEQRLRHQARSDGLTDLPNREVLHEAVDRALARVDEEGRAFALMIVDLDRFKLVNDSLGHAAGDHLLRLVSHRIAGVLRPNDVLARIGGDEFAILLDDVNDISDIQIIARRIRQVLAEPFDLAGRPHSCAASVGIVLGDRGHGTRASLLRDADTAMYEAKRRGRGDFVLFTQAMHERVARRFRLESDLGFAASRNELRVYYQPIIDLVAGRIAGFEALVRWHHPELGLLSPDEFLGVATESGRMLAIDSWVHETAVRQMVEWKQQFGIEFMTVNCSSDTVLSSQFERHNARVLAETGLDPSCLSIEITEHVLIEDVEEAARRLALLKHSGVSICVDDFGTGYSSLNLLHTLPIDTVKIDRSLIRDIEHSERGFSIVKSVADLAHGLDMVLVAEGIENEEQLSRVRALGYQFGQGFYFSRPVPAERVTERLEEQRVRKSTPARADRDAIGPKRTGRSKSKKTTRKR